MNKNISDRGSWLPRELHQLSSAFEVRKTMPDGDKDARKSESNKNGKYVGKSEITLTS